MNQEFFLSMLNTMSVSGHEIALQKKVIEEMTPYCDQILTDNTGNVISVLNPEAGFKVLLAGHIDEIGLILTHIQGDGLLRVTNAGGIRAGVYPGHQVVIYGKNGPVPGIVIYNKAMRKEDLSASDLMIDIGAKDADDARNYVSEGDPIHIASYPKKMANGYLCSRAIDDRGGAFIILEALKKAKSMGCRIGVYAATTVGEETTMRGAHWAAQRVRPHVGIAVDVTYAQDYPGTNPVESGDVRLGKGPVLCHSSIANKKLNALLMDLAKANDIPYQTETFVGRTGTDADRIHFAADGVTTALVSLPLRYMHSPSEMCSLADVQSTIDLLAQFLCAIDETTVLDPFA